MSRPPTTLHLLAGRANPNHTVFDTRICRRRQPTAAPSVRIGIGATFEDVFVVRTVLYRYSTLTRLQLLFISKNTHQILNPHLREGCSGIEPARSHHCCRRPWHTSSRRAPEETPGLVQQWPGHKYASRHVLRTMPGVAVGRRCQGETSWPQPTLNGRRAVCWVDLQRSKKASSVESRV